MNVSKKSTDTVKPGGEGGTPGFIAEETETLTLTETETFESLSAGASTPTKPGGEGGTPGV